MTRSAGMILILASWVIGCSPKNGSQSSVNPPDPTVDKIQENTEFMSLAGYRISEEWEAEFPTLLQITSSGKVTVLITDPFHDGKPGTYPDHLIREGDKVYLSLRNGSEDFEKSTLSKPTKELPIKQVPVHVSEDGRMTFDSGGIVEVLSRYHFVTLSKDEGEKKLVELRERKNNPDQVVDRMKAGLSGKWHLTALNKYRDNAVIKTVEASAIPDFVDEIGDNGEVIGKNFTLKSFEHLPTGELAVNGGVLRTQVDYSGLYHWITLSLDDSGRSLSIFHFGKQQDLELCLFQTLDESTDPKSTGIRFRDEYCYKKVR